LLLLLLLCLRDAAATRFISVISEGDAGFPCPAEVVRLLLDEEAADKRREADAVAATAAF
jgi:hypothetical protein